MFVNHMLTVRTARKWDRLVRYGVTENLVEMGIDYLWDTFRDDAIRAARKEHHDNKGVENPFEFEGDYDAPIGADGTIPIPEPWRDYLASQFKLWLVKCEGHLYIMKDVDLQLLDAYVKFLSELAFVDGKCIQLPYLLPIESRAVTRCKLEGYGDRIIVRFH